MTENSKQTDCLIVGAGPAGVILSLLLARKGIDVTLLEIHKDFDRDFRGDTIHPSVLENLDQIGLADKLHKLPHAKLAKAILRTEIGEDLAISFENLKTKYPYIMMIPQAMFLEFIANEAKKYNNFNLLMGANAQELVVEAKTVKGMIYKDMSDGSKHEIRSTLVVGTDGRNSRLRRLSGLKLNKTAPPMDVLWFRLPKEKGENPDETRGGRFGGGHFIVILDRETEWQIGYVIPKGTYKKIREAGIEELRKNVAALLPEFTERAEHLESFKQVAMLSVESSRLEKWYSQGLLLIGDAAHVMSPVGGVGINYAIQDAVVTANVLTEPLKNKKVTEADLARVQKKREFPTRFIQFFQSRIQRRVVAEALDKSKPFKLPFFMRLPLVRDIPPRIVAFGWRKVRIEGE
jgi:2-polyprenyl-6-methoxyphenol hydroxylase-like FAD-dependent oxidoreductase